MFLSRNPVVSVLYSLPFSIKRTNSEEYPKINGKTKEKILNWKKYCICNRYLLWRNFFIHKNKLSHKNNERINLWLIYWMYILLEPIYLKWRLMKTLSTWNLLANRTVLNLPFSALKAYWSFTKHRAHIFIFS